MKPSILHITNGDSTTNYLQALKFEGEFITWREMLCEGKTSIDVGSESFWKTRFDFFKSSYKVTKKTFIDLTLKEYRNLCQKKDQKEIVLWFEYDLFCQINMIAIISWIKRYRKGEKVSLVCSGTVKGSKKKLGLSELNKEQIQQHYKNRVELSQDDIEYADYIWQLYCSDSPLRLETVHKFNPMSPFVYLSDAIDVHLQRFPSIENGLNVVENYILDIANKTKPESKNQLVGNLLKNQETLGFGDTQYFQKLEKLKSLFTSFHPVKLSRKGKKVLDHQLNFYQSLRNEHTYLGGVKKYSYLYHNATDKLLKITS
ncbi:DUF1835 domain-containing protein [Pseudotenacibaculum sp. MALMAid0570]|uniref:DUF1835 domain-containing protein n=1 Tax=Pseudotenacibaculum sp. MALMAid0570 TaxID=3143938 RepID=UPI0032DEDA4D